MDVSRTTDLTPRSVLPGLAFILAVDLLGSFGGRAPRLLSSPLVPVVLLVLPWITIGILRLSPRALGFSRARMLACFGWGMVAGGVWRLASLGLNMWLQGGDGALGLSSGGVLAAAVWVPGLEETFYRGYLGRGLQPRLGRWGAILVQAVLFCCYPGHWLQGMPHVISIFAFGVLAGWLVARTRSIWSAWGAHALANLIPLLLGG